MGNRQSDSQTNPTVPASNPQVVNNPATSSSPIISPSPVPPSTSKSSQSANESNAPYTVFISHAGEDKVTIAIPLREKLQRRGITAFVDIEDMPPGTDAEKAMIHAMKTASIGVFVMSPEFVARKWPIKELMTFLKRRDDPMEACCDLPKIIPFFYRLGISDLYDEPRLDRRDKDGNMLYEVSRFYERQARGEQEANIAVIKAALARLHKFMGVENTVYASNDASYNNTINRNFVLDMLYHKICQAASGLTIPRAVMKKASEPERDTFRPCFDKAYDVSDLVFDFDRKDSNGDISTQEGKILEMLLDKSKNRNRAIAVCGIGGVGKTSLLRKIRNLDGVFERFKDGVYEMELGKDVTCVRLKEMLISVILKSGGQKAAHNLRTETDVGKVIEGFRTWFAQRQCLFIIDDVWETKEVTRGTIHGIWNLHTSGRDSKTLLTTRSKAITADGTAYFFLEPREALEGESRAILYHYAGLKPEPEQDEDNRAVNEILERCAGLPLFLGVAGKSVKTLSFRRNHTGCMAYRSYAKQLKESMADMINTGAGSHEGLSAGLKISIQLVEERKQNIRFDLCVSMAEMHRRLSVVKKQMAVPMSMLKHLWEVESEHQAAWVAKEFEQVGLADVEYEKEEDAEVEVLRMHDSVYEFAVHETDCRREQNKGHAVVIKGYRKSDRHREWWSEELEDDKYIHGNICRHLKEGGLEVELFELLLSPEWLERQFGLNGVASAEGDFAIGIEVTRMRTGRADDGDGVDMFEALKLIREAVTLSSSYILKNGSELWFQVHGRLKRAGQRNRLMRDYLTRIEKIAPKPGVLCMSGMLMGAGGANTRIITIGSAVTCMLLLKDGDHVVCGCMNGDIAIVNVRRSVIEMRWRAHDHSVTAIDVGKDDTRIVSVSRDNAANVWDVQSGECVAIFEGHKNVVKVVAITQDGKRVVSGCYDGDVQVWDIENGQRVGTPIMVVSTSILTVFRDGEYLVTGGEEGELEIWNVSTNTKVGASFDGHTGPVLCVAMTDDESRLVTGSWDETVRLWNVQRCEQVGESFEGHTFKWVGGELIDPVTCVATNADGSRVASGSGDLMIRVWDVQNREQVCDPVIGHTDEITAISFLGERDVIVSCSIDGTLRAWDLNKKTEEMMFDRHKAEVTSVLFTPNNGKVAVSLSREDGTLLMWNVISGRIVGQPLLRGAFFSAMALSPDGRFAVGCDRKRVVVWDLQYEALAHTFNGHTDYVNCVVVTPDGDRAVTGSSDRTVRVWNLKSKDTSHIVLEGHSNCVERVFVTDDGKRIISVDGDDNIFVWNIETRMVRTRERGHNANFLSRRKVLAFVGEATVHDEAGLSIPPGANQIIHGEGSKANVLATLESTTINDWDISPDKQTVCLGLSNGRVIFLKLQL